MSSRTAIIASSIGLHARHATRFSRKVAASGVRFHIGRVSGRPVNAASVLSVMALGIKCGEEVVVSTDALDAEDVLNDLVSFLETDHDSTPYPRSPVGSY